MDFRMAVVLLTFLHNAVIISVTGRGDGDDDDGHPLIKSCSKLSTCSCKSHHNGVVDLSPLAKSDGTPRFEKISSGIQEYSWNPCKSFTQGSCHDVAVCQKSTFPSTQYYNLGIQDSAKFKADEDGLQIIYRATTWGSSRANATRNQKGNQFINATFSRTSYVRLVCDLNKTPGVLTAEGEDRNWPGRYYFTLTSYHACPSYLKPAPADTSSLSTGSCFLLVAFSLLLCFGLVLVDKKAHRHRCFVMVVIYLVLGSIVQIFMFKRTGIDAIPNKSFWMAIPGLVKDGTFFVLRRGKQTGGYTEV